MFSLITQNHDFAKWKMVIVKTILEFTGQIYCGKDVEIRTWVKKIGNSSLELYEELYQNGKLCTKKQRFTSIMTRMRKVPSRFGEKSVRN